ncbi:Maf family protein [Desulfuromonas acetoxidans]|uniref:Maf family protein n=1 Tax=Desulfuromonas acetoxidans TaxID=891 RepID=UPI00292CB2BA|nr:Maf family protein [Desulfuromonas acetoxidans]
MTPDTSNIVLASASPRRRELLAGLGIDFQVVPSQIDEDRLEGESAEEFVRRLSRDKALDVANRSDIDGRWFIGSDTIVVCDQQILGKPTDHDDARRMLQMLSGRSHQVMSAYTIHDRETEEDIVRCEITEVWFRPLTGREIEGYIASGEPADKAGSYAIQGLGAFMVTAIHGSYTSVVGLPLSQIVSDLIQLGAVALFADDTSA